MQYSEHRRGMLAVLVAAVLWSTGGLFIKLSSVDALTLSCLRCAYAALVFLVIFRKRVFLVNGRAMVNAGLYAGLLITFVYATKLTTAANAIFLQFTAPIYVLLLEPLLLKTRLERINVITVTVCFLGMALFFLGKLSPSHLYGNIFGLVSGVLFAGFLLGQRRNAAQYQESSIFWGNVLGALLCLPALLAAETALPATDLAITAYLGVVQIGISYAVFTYGLKRVLAVEGALLAMIEPVLNPVWVFLGYGERPSPGAIAGGIIILLAIAARTIVLERRRITTAKPR